MNQPGSISRGRVISVLTIKHIGKETNLLEQQEEGVLLANPQAAYPGGGELEMIQEWLGRMSIPRLAEISGVSERMLRAIRTGERNPAADNLAAIEWALTRSLRLNASIASGKNRGTLVPV